MRLIDHRAARRRVCCDGVPVLPSVSLSSTSDLVRAPAVRGRTLAFVPFRRSMTSACDGVSVVSYLTELIYRGGSNGGGTETHAL